MPSWKRLQLSQVLIEFEVASDCVPYRCKVNVLQVLHVAYITKPSHQCAGQEYPNLAHRKDFCQACNPTLALTSHTLHEKAEVTCIQQGKRVSVADVHRLSICSELHLQQQVCRSMTKKVLAIMKF